ncbi:NUDIX hydrolase [Patescibacteria group bacterium]|nr:NUDIX hydrolase [Patescibacteria group bacterium]MCL5091515.1 NUDIX hydrolase [Patescibacteria group bacterium]
MAVPETVAALIISQEHGPRYLLAQRTGSLETNRWGPPGGHIRLHEPPNAAVQREIWEETGLWIPETDLTSLGKGKQYFTVNEQAFLLYGFAILHNPPMGQPSRRDSHHKDWSWIPASEVTDPNFPLCLSAVALLHAYRFYLAHQRRISEDLCQLNFMPNLTARRLTP